MFTRKITTTYSLNNWAESIIKNIRKMSTSDPNDVLFKEVNDKGIIILNRPKALNSLNTSMVDKIYPTLLKWQSQKSLVIIKGAGGKAFCAGGDVKAIAESAFKGDKNLGCEFFRKEYTNNELIGSYKMPYVAFIDGIVMGGGVGLSVHGPYRVATEKSLFAMPETQIGLFPDVGGSHFLPRLEGKLGWFLALTGYRLKGYDVLKAGVATHFCDSSNINSLEEALLQCSNKQDIENTLNKFNKTENKDLSLKPHMNKINKIFSAPTIEQVIEGLKKDGSKWAEETLTILKKMSPTSLKVTHKELELGKNLNLEECLKMEYRIAVNCVQNHDFKEGVRALLIDKDQNPKWNPACIEDVTDEIVDRHFAKLPEELELKHKL